MNLLEAYFSNAWAIAILHLIFFITCLSLWMGERLRLLREKRAYSSLPLDSLKDDSNSEIDDWVVERKKAEIPRLVRSAISMTKKGTLPSQETVRLRLLRSLARNEVIVRTCLNGFIISGLIGTLYNLWQLGPTFWEGLIQGRTQTSYPSIGIAFSASVFGLGYALVLTFVDNLLMRRPREEFVREASNSIYDSVSALMPATEWAAVAEALHQFHSTSSGVLKKFQDRHEEISRQFTEQIKISSEDLSRTMNSVASSWEGLANRVTGKIQTVGEKIEFALHDLTASTAKTSQVLNGATERLQEAEQASASLLELRTKVEVLLAEINTQLAGFNDQWKVDLNNLTQAHVARLEEASKTGWDRYEEETSKWHHLNVTALEHFSDSIQQSMSQWGEERNQVGVMIDALVDGWRRELGQNITAMQAGLGQLQQQIVGLQQASTQLANANNSNIQQLNTLHNAVANISNNIVNGTPIGAALKNMTHAVEELRAFLGTYTPPKVNGGPSQAGQDLRRIYELLLHITAQLESISSDSLQKKEGGSVTSQAPTSSNYPGSDAGRVIFQADRPRSKWRRFWPLKRRRQ